MSERTVAVRIEWDPPWPSYAVRYSVNGSSWFIETFCTTYWGARFAAWRLRRRLERHPPRVVWESA